MDTATDKNFIESMKTCQYYPHSILSLSFTSVIPKISDLVQASLEVTSINQWLTRSVILFADHSGIPSDVRAWSTGPTKSRRRIKWTGIAWHTFKVSLETCICAKSPGTFARVFPLPYNRLKYRIPMFYVLVCIRLWYRSILVNKKRRLFSGQDRPS